MTLNLSTVVHFFRVPGSFVDATSFGGGHIHDSYSAAFQQGDTIVRYLLQRINTQVFTHPLELMENIARVTAHIAVRISEHPDHLRRVLNLVPTLNGQFCHLHEDGSYWRMYRMIEGAAALDAITTTEQAFKIAQAFGEFQRNLATMPPPRLYETIPDFHNTPKRFADLEAAISADVCNRAASARAEIDFALNHRSVASALLGAGLPERITHNDTKYDNVLIDRETGDAVCVVDLDTVMPGLAPYDFGDMVRSMTSPAPEDERDLSRVSMRFPVFEALARGFLSSAGVFLTCAEKEALPLGGKVITYENGLRFLSDYLAGDTYYKVHRAGQNLDRCRTQFKLVESIEQQEPEMARLIKAIA